MRPFIVVLLLESLIERRHEVFKGKGSAAFLKEKVRAAVAREYPEKEGHLPIMNPTLRRIQIQIGIPPSPPKQKSHGDGYGYG